VRDLGARLDADVIAVTADTNLGIKVDEEQAGPDSRLDFGDALAFEPGTIDQQLVARARGCASQAASYKCHKPRNPGRQGRLQSGVPHAPRRGSDEPTTSRSVQAMIETRRFRCSPLPRPGATRLNRLCMTIYMENSHPLAGHLPWGRSISRQPLR